MPRIYKTLLLCVLLAVSASARSGGMDELKQGDALLRQGHARRALQALDSAIASKELSVAVLAIAYIKRAEAATALGDAKLAIESYTKVVEIDPRNPVGYNYRGRLYLQLQQHDKAVADFSRVIALDPNKAEGWSNRAMARLARGDIGGPLEDLRYAIQAEPNNPAAYYFRGNLYFYQGNYAAAAADFRHHAKLVPGDAYTVIKLYLTAARSEDKAEQELSTLAREVTGKAWPRPILDLYLGKRDAESILTELQPAGSREQRERACEAYFYIAYYFLLGGKQDKARELFAKAVATGVSDFNEYKTAKAELWRMPQQ